MVGLGTPAYMAPEQARGLDPLPQTDIYALGIVLFEMLTGGERPFTGEQSKTTGSTSEKVRWEQINLPPPSPKRWNPDISDELEAVVLKCLAKDPAERYASPLDLLNALELALPVGESLDNAETLIAEPTPGGDSIKVTEVPDGQKEPQELPADEEKPRRRSLVPVLIGLGLAAIIVGVGMFLMGRGGTGPLSMLAAATDTPTVTASPLPTETLQDTPAPLPTATAVPASITPSATWTLTQTPSPTPTDTATSPPTDTPTVTQTLTPSPLPEGYALVPDVTGLDFYIATLKLKEAGFVVEKDTQFRLEVARNEVYKQEPTAGVGIPKNEKVKIFIATDIQTYLLEHVYVTNNTETRLYKVNLPKKLWCQTSFINHTSSDWETNWDITFPDGSVRSKDGFATKDEGIHEILVTFTRYNFYNQGKVHHVEGDIWVWCKPNNENNRNQTDDDIISLEKNDSGEYSGFKNVSVYVDRNAEIGIASIETYLPEKTSCQISIQGMSSSKRSSDSWDSWYWYDWYWDLSGNIINPDENIIGELFDNGTIYLKIKEGGLHTISLKIRYSGWSGKNYDSLLNVQVLVSCEQSE